MGHSGRIALRRLTGDQFTAKLNFAITQGFCIELPVMFRIFRILVELTF